MKLGRCIKELERIYGIKHGGSGYYGNQHEESGNNFVTPKTERDLANEIGVDVRTLQNYKKLTEMIPELHRTIAVYAMEHGKTLNAVVEEAIGNMVCQG